MGVKSGIGDRPKMREAWEDLQEAFGTTPPRRDDEDGEIRYGYFTPPTDASPEVASTTDSATLQYKYRLYGKDGQQCSMDPKLGTVVHRYDIGQRTCRCGTERNACPEEKPKHSWRQKFVQTNSNSKPNPKPKLKRESVPHRKHPRRTPILTTSKK